MTESFSCDTICQEAMDGRLGDLRALGLRITPQRAAIVRFLHGNTDHPSAEEIFEAVRAGHPGLSFATVYNTLEALTKRGALKALTMDPARRRYDPDPREHDHVVCTACARVTDVPGGPSSPDASRALRTGYAVMGGHREFHGLCPECQSAGQQY